MPSFVSEADLTSTIKHVILSVVGERLDDLEVHMEYPVRFPVRTKMKTRRVSETMVAAFDSLGRKRLLYKPVEGYADLVVQERGKSLLVVEVKWGTEPGDEAITSGRDSRRT